MIFILELFIANLDSVHGNFKKLSDLKLCFIFKVIKQKLHNCCFRPAGQQGVPLWRPFNHGSCCLKFRIELRQSLSLLTKWDYQIRWKLSPRSVQSELTSIRLYLDKSSPLLAVRKMKILNLCSSPFQYIHYHFKYNLSMRYATITRIHFLLL